MSTAVMIADRLLPNCDFDLRAAIDLSYSVNANHIKGTDYTRFAPVFAEKLGLRYQTSDNVEDIRHCLRTGGAVAALVRGNRDGQVGLFTHGSHYITIINEEPDGRFAILDPYFFDDKFEEEGRQGKVELKNGVIVLCDGAILADEASREFVPFYLFWRS